MIRRMAGSRPARIDARRWATVAIVVVGTAGVAAGLVVAAGADPLAGLRGLVEGVSTSPYRVGELLVGTVPIAIIALTLIPALRAGIFSVGAEGQVIVGAILATGATFLLVDVFGDGVPPVAYWIAGALAGGVGGALFALVPAVLAERWRVNEILSTLLLNYLATGLLGWSLRTWLASPDDTATPQSEQLPDAAALPALIPSTRAHVAILLVVAIAVAFVLWRRSAAATRTEVFASRPKLARRLGTTRARTIYSTMLVSGAGAGVVGWIQVAGVNERLLNSVSGGVGFSGLAVALLGGLTPVGILAGALFFSALTAGANGMQSATGGAVPSSIAEVIKGVLLLGVAIIAATQRSRAIAALAPSDATPTAADEVAPDGAAVAEDQIADPAADDRVEAAR